MRSSDAIEPNRKEPSIMGQYAVNTSVREAVGGGGLLVVAQWEAKEGQADRIADILSQFLPEAQSEPGARLFLIGRAKENPAQFLFYELFRDEAALRRIRRARISRPISPARPCRCSPSANARNTRCCNARNVAAKQSRAAVISAT
jgi:quinol monooxygenase YgiN